MLSPGTGKYESYCVAVGAEIPGQSCCMALPRLEWLEVDTGDMSSLSGVGRGSNGGEGVDSRDPPLLEEHGVSVDGLE